MKSVRYALSIKDTDGSHSEVIEYAAFADDATDQEINDDLTAWVSEHITASYDILEGGKV